MVKYIIVFLALFSYIKSYAWTSPPLPPALQYPPKPISITKIESEKIEYRDYQPGQIKLDKKRLSIFSSKLHNTLLSNNQVKEIRITGFSDKMGIKNHHKIWKDIPSSIRPIDPNLVNNKLIAEARAMFIREYAKINIGYHLPTNTMIKSIDNLKISKKNRGVEVVIEYTPSFGINKPPPRIRNLP